MNEPLQTEKVGELSLSHSFSISKLVCWSECMYQEVVKLPW
jgi:hypothetical protein